MLSGLLDMVQGGSGSGGWNNKPPPGVKDQRSGLDPDTVIQSTLNSARRHLGMKVAYISRIDGDKSHLVYVDAPGFETVIRPGSVRDLESVYCQHILDGRIPALLPDAACHPLTRQMPITHAVPVGAHISVPIRTRGGEIAFLFCCMDTEANPSLNARDLGVARLFAEIAGAQIDLGEEDQRQVIETRRRMERLVARKEFSIVYQPLWNIRVGTVFGFECLARFPADPERSAESWFEEADSVGLLADLEIALIIAALSSANSLPETVSLSINVSAATVLDSRFIEALRPFNVARLIIELTEHAQIDDYEAVAAALRPLREMGARIAVDDAGSGFASLQHLIGVNADLIKLDRSLIQGIDRMPASRAMIAALRHFAADTNSTVLAEGIETQAEFDALAALGVEFGQGYFLGKPMSFKLARELLRRVGTRPPRR